MSERNEVVIVTGASSGIGRATALAWARRGATVVGVARREDRLRELVGLCRPHSPASTYRAGDLGERDFARSVVDDTVEQFGRVDVLVNNAAVPCHRDLYGVSVEDAETVFRINFLSCLWTTFAAIPPMLAAGSGTLVNVSSLASKIVPTHETVYAASKCAMNGFSEGLRNDLRGSGIHVCLIQPGPIATEIWDRIEDFEGYRGRLHPPEIVAQGILEAVRSRRFEVVLPRRDPMLMLAGLLRRLAPGLVRLGVRRQASVRPGAIARARERARRGLRLGE